MTTDIRASDAERERIATIISAAGGEGRLTMAETEERLAGVYAARYRHELEEFVADLPRAEPDRRRERTPGAHPLRRPPAPVLILFAVLAVTGIVHAVIGGGHAFFFPFVPLSWIAAFVIVRRGAHRRYTG